MRTYLVVMDETREARIALRFAARRAAKTGGTVEMLALIPPQEFVQWGAVQDAMEEEARLRAEAMVVAAAGEMLEESGVHPTIVVRQGEAVDVIRELLAEDREIAALVLGAAESGPGPLVTHFVADAGALPCPLMIVPGSLTDEGLDGLS